jgi:hypothetical protein
MSYRKFRVYLKEKYDVQKAYIFIGFVALNQKLYDSCKRLASFSNLNRPFMMRMGK